MTNNDYYDNNKIFSLSPCSSSSFFDLLLLLLPPLSFPSSILFVFFLLHPCSATLLRAKSMHCKRSQWSFRSSLSLGYMSTSSHQPKFLFRPSELFYISHQPSGPSGVFQIDGPCSFPGQCDSEVTVRVLCSSSWLQPGTML